MESTAEDDSETAEEEEDEEFVADSSRDEDMTLQPVPQGLKPFPPGLVSRIELSAFNTND